MPPIGASAVAMQAVSEDNADPLPAQPSEESQNTLGTVERLDHLATVGPRVAEATDLERRLWIPSKSHTFSYFKATTLA